MRQFCDDADVGLAPPFAVRDDVDPGMLLHGHGVTDGRLHFVLVPFRRQRGAVVDKVEHEGRARERADDGGRE